MKTCSTKENHQKRKIKYLELKIQCKDLTADKTQLKRELVKQIWKKNLQKLSKMYSRETGDRKYLIQWQVMVQQNFQTLLLGTTTLENMWTLFSKAEYVQTMPVLGILS